MDVDWKMNSKFVRKDINFSPNTFLSGCLVLVLILLVLFLTTTIYHYCTMNVPFTDVLYFEFVRLSAIGFGDILPEDEMTLAGAILKNLFLHIPNQIILFTLFVRILPFLY